MNTRPLQIKTQAFLANLPMFSDMRIEELDRIAAATLAVYAPKGQALFQCGDPCTGFHVVVYGQVKLGFTSPQGIEKVVEIFNPGQSFGQASMFLDVPYIVFAQALSDSMLLHVAKHAVLDELKRDPGFAGRVIGYLLGDVADVTGNGKPVEVHLTPGKSVIASRLNMTPEHFSRILHDLAAAGLIEMNGRAVRIPDLERLRRGG